MSVSAAAAGGCGWQKVSPSRPPAISWLPSSATHRNGTCQMRSPTQLARSPSLDAPCVAAYERSSSQHLLYLPESSDKPADKRSVCSMTWTSARERLVGRTYACCWRSDRKPNLSPFLLQLGHERPIASTVCGHKLKLRRRNLIYSHAVICWYFTLLSYLFIRCTKTSSTVIFRGHS